MPKFGGIKATIILVAATTYGIRCFLLSTAPGVVVGEPWDTADSLGHSNGTDARQGTATWSETQHRHLEARGHSTTGIAGRRMADMTPLNTVNVPFKSSPENSEQIWEQLQISGSTDDVPSRYDQQEKLSLHDYTDQGDFLSAIDGFRTIRRADLLQDPSHLFPANGLDFVSTVQSYFPIFENSLFPRLFLTEEVLSMPKTEQITRFLLALKEKQDNAAIYLSTYYGRGEEEIPQQKEAGYEPIPSVSSVANVFIAGEGVIYDDKHCIVLKSCLGWHFFRRSTEVPAQQDRYKEVFVITQFWGDNYFHFVVECLTKISLFLDVLLKRPEIKIAVSADHPYSRASRMYILDFMGLLGISSDRLVFVGDDSIFAETAYIPESTPCGQPNTAGVILLRSALLKGLYPSTNGVPPRNPRPFILIIERKTRRYLANSMEVTTALQETFPEYEVVPFLGMGTARDQLDMFARAQAIVAPHGAGLSNILVSRLHTPILEIGPASCSICYIHLAVKLQHVYGRHPGADDWNATCNMGYMPEVTEVVDLFRALLDAKELADEADPPVHDNLSQEAAALPAVDANNLSSADSLKTVHQYGRERAMMR